jgi:uncharacterized protein
VDRPIFDFSQPLLLAGLLLGFSSSLHCFGMCSGIAASLHFAAAAKTGASRGQWSTAGLINAGRVTGYVVAGVLAGELGSRAFGFLDRSAMNAVLRWAGAASLGWSGLSMIGFLPLPAFFYRIGMAITDGMNALAATLRLPPSVALFVSGHHLGLSALRHGLRHAVLRHAFRLGCRRRGGDARRRHRASA